jgi:glycosyltransferase involved in cell wall biosynthesis
MKKILFITAFPSNKKTAGQNFSRQLISKLSKSSNIDLLYFSYKEHQLDKNLEVNKVIKIKNNGLRKILNVLLYPFFHPFFISRFSWTLLFTLIKKRKNYDMLIFDFTQVQIYSYFLKHSNKIHICHDVIQQKFSRSKGKIECFFINFSEKHILKRANKIFTFSQKDSGLIKKYYGLDSEKVNFFLDEAIVDIKNNVFQVENYFMMYGAWNRKENYEGLDWFLINVFPFLHNFDLKIIGPKMPNRLLKKIDGLKSIEYLGFVDNPYVVISKSKALIAPVFSGAGVKVKVVESLSLGVDVIGTKIAFEGIECYNENFVCNSDEDFISILSKFNTNKIDSDIRMNRKLEFHKIYKDSKLVEILLGL